MNQVLRFRGDQSGRHLLSDIECKKTGKRSLPFHSRRHRFTIDEFHGIEMSRAMLTKVKYGSDVPVPQFGGAARLSQKTASRSRIL